MSVTRLLANSGLSDQVVSLIDDALSTQSDGADMPLILKNIAGRGTATALHNDDLPLLEAAASLTVGYLGATSIVAWAPAAIAGLVVLLYKYRKKRLELSAMQAALLIELKSNGPLTAKELVMSPAMEKLTESEVTAELQRLTRFARYDGVRTSLVESDGQDMWRAVDV